MLGFYVGFNQMYLRQFFNQIKPSRLKNLKIEKLSFRDDTFALKDCLQMLVRCIMMSIIFMQMSCGYQFQNRQDLKSDLNPNVSVEVEDLQSHSQESHTSLKSIFIHLFTNMVATQSTLGASVSSYQAQIILLGHSKDEIESYDQFGRLNITQSKIRLKIKIRYESVLWESSIQESIFSNRYHSPYGLHLSESVSQNEWYLCLKNAIQEYLEVYPNQSKSNRDQK